ncbi:DUF4344 domain-containing metallopeptidase [Streptomyces sp. NPDC059491]|uniref:DUF4344 domain-containing metallopeptidase n=1 Tax=Streptomyces sp. NPDC059491 TaxID=3346850 RepID=UPI0036C87982
MRFHRTGASALGAAVLLALGASTATAAPAVPGPGVLVAGYAPAETAPDLTEQRFLERNEVLEGAAAHANALIGLPRDVPVTAQSCGEINAFYDPGSQGIAFCYELVGHYRGIFDAQNTAGTEAQRSRATEDDLIGISNSVVFHEFAHALIDIYDLPATGREEDAADQLATLLLAGDSVHQGYAVSAIEAWGALAASSSQGELGAQLPDEHSLDAQRYYNAICWLYGSDPAAFQGAVRTDANPDGPLPQSRAAGCPEEFAKIDRAWSTLLQPYLKG